ncbi:hypothetical protein [Streptacidiphilus sp. P02-A3a]|uniref:hypothetical protein n=1 Tax=Streptacidiphilus sp. P02-A3a TaxID=2704468 RepID=UPI0015FB01DE|nr:hypothetical protein [Streptacidiphilus sp. P02-A3a]QMU69150.1 hypothetical protein GXP74_13725 [Streptacidiphilus sp. P02-A3a]
MAAPERGTWTVYRATVLMALGLAACALLTSAAEYAGARRAAVPPVASTLAVTGACAAHSHHSARHLGPRTLRMVDCRDHAARFEVLRVLLGSDPARCDGVPGAELAFPQPATRHHPASTLCVTLLDVQARGPLE